MKKQIVEKLATLVTAAFGLVAALAWNDTVKAVIKRIFGTPDTIWAMLVYAVVITAVAVVATIWIGKVSERAK